MKRTGFLILLVSMVSSIFTVMIYKYFDAPQQVIIRESSPAKYTNYTDRLFSDVSKRQFLSSSPTNFTSAAGIVTPAVVNIRATTENDFDLWGGYGGSTGSGVIISPDGYIVTNNHVMDGATELEITLNNRKKYKATLVGTDVKNDIALLKIEATEALPYIPFSDSDTIKIGEWVLAVGNPYNLTSTVTAGIVSAKGRDLQGNSATDSFIQTDAAVNPGNSGGALVNTRGELVGINTAISSKTGSYIGYSFAVPSNIAKKIIDDILEFGKVQEAIIGFVPDLREDDIEGVRIGDFAENSNAEKAGLKKGDVIVQIDDVKISKFSELSGQLSAKRPGESVNLTINREGEVFTKNIQLIKRIERFISRSYGLEFQDDVLGAKIIREASSIYNFSSLVGYVITEINDQKIASASEAVALLDGLSRNGYRVKVKMIDLNGEIGAYFF